MNHFNVRFRVRGIILQKLLARRFAVNYQAEAFPFGQEEGDEVLALFAVRTGEQEEVSCKVDRHARRAMVVCY